MKTPTSFTTTSVMDWAVVAPFLTSPEASWLDPFVDPSRHRLRLIPMGDSVGSWHAKKKGITSLPGWRNYEQTTRRAWATKPDGIITVFPQMAITAGMQKRLSRSRTPVVAWCLNVGRSYPGLKRSLARFALNAVDCYVVHSRREIGLFDLPRERFEFVPLQRGYLEPTIAEETQKPFLLSMGSARRDYRTLLEAIRPLRIPTILVASPRVLEGLDIPDFVEVRSNLSRDQCLELVQKAKLNVVPIDNDETASGQVTVIEAMWLSRPVIATQSIGTEDYITSGVDGHLVPPKDPLSLRQSIEKLWDDDETRRRLGQAARERAIAEFSDQVAGAALNRILDRFHR